MTPRSTRPMPLGALIVYDREGSPDHRRALALAEHAPADFSVEIARAGASGSKPTDVLLVLTENEDLASSGGHVGATILASRERWENAGRRRATHVLSAGSEAARAVACYELLRFVAAGARPASEGLAAASIVIPLLRQEDGWLEQCVRSALAQTVAVDVLVVVARETPASNHAVLERLAAGSAGRLQILEEPPGAGFAGAINAGIRAARTARVGLLLSDDWLEPSAVEVCLGRPEDVVATGHTVHDASGEATLWSTIPGWARYQKLPTLEAKAGYLEHFFLFRRATLFDAGGVDPAIGTTGPDDYDLIWCLLERGATVGLVPEPLYHYRDHTRERLTLRARERQIADLEKILIKHGIGEAERARLIAGKSRWYGEPCHVVLERIRREKLAGC